MLAGSGGLDGVVKTFTQVSVLPVVEWYVLFGMIRRLDQRDVPALLAYGSLALVVVASAAIRHQRVAFLWEATLLSVLWIGTPVLRRIGLILLIIAVQREKGLTPLHGLFGWLDAHMVSALMSVIGHPVTRVGNLIVSPGMPDGLVVLAGCASTHLMIPMGLGLAALLLASRDRLTRADYGWIGVTLVAAVAMNIMRLVLMLQSHAAYLSWHEGTGASIVSVAGLIVTLAAWMAATGRTGTAP